MQDPDGPDERTGTRTEASETTGRTSAAAEDEDPESHIIRGVD
ncbi:hypothetical protein [Streptomyces sp. NPDC049555]